MTTEKLRMSFVLGQDNNIEVTYPRLYTLSEFMSRYGEDNLTIMLQDREATLYQRKAEELILQMREEPDAEQNIQAALDAWKPHDDRPPTELEAMANQFLNLPASAQTILRKHINTGVAAQNLVAAKAQAEVASAQVKDMDAKYAPPDNVGPPIVEGAQEPVLTSFEDAGRIAEEVVREAPQPVVEAKEIVQATTLQHADDVAASEDDYTAPVEQEEGGTEGVVIEPEAQTPIPEE